MCESEFPEIVTVRLFAQQQEPSSTALGSHAHGTQLTATQESGLRRESCATADRARGSIRYTRYYLMVMPDVRCGCARARLIVHSWPPRTGASIYALRPVLRYTAYRSVRGHTDSLSTEYNGAYVLTYMTYPAVDPLAARSAHLCVWMMHQPFGAASSPLLVPRVCTHSTRHARVPAVPILPHGERARGARASTSSSPHPITVSRAKYACHGVLPHGRVRLSVPLQARHPRDLRRVRQPSSSAEFVCQVRQPNSSAEFVSRIRAPRARRIWRRGTCRTSCRSPAVDTNRSWMCLSGP